MQCVLRKDCDSDTKDVYMPHSSFVFYRQQLRFLAERKSLLKLDKVFYLLNILPAYEEPQHLYNLYVENGLHNEFPRCIL